MSHQSFRERAAIHFATSVLGRHEGDSRDRVYVGGEPIEAAQLLADAACAVWGHEMGTRGCVRCGIVPKRCRVATCTLPTTHEGPCKLQGSPPLTEAEVREAIGALGGAIKKTRTIQYGDCTDLQPPARIPFPCTCTWAAGKIVRLCPSHHEAAQRAYGLARCSMRFDTGSENPLQKTVQCIRPVNHSGNCEHEPLGKQPSDSFGLDTSIRAEVEGCDILFTLSDKCRMRIASDGGVYLHGAPDATGAHFIRTLRACIDPLQQKPQAKLEIAQPIAACDGSGRMPDGTLCAGCRGCR